MSHFVPILRDEEQASVPSDWRSTLRDIVGAFKEGNFSLRRLADVDMLDEATATGTAQNIENYGCTLSALSDQSWDTSV